MVGGEPQNQEKRPPGGYWRGLFVLDSDIKQVSPCTKAETVQYNG